MRPFVILCLVLPLTFELSNAAEPSSGLNPGKPLADQRVPNVQQPSELSLSAFLDDLFDYDVYMADPATVTGWYIKWTYADGVVVYTSPSQSETYTLDLMVRLLLRCRSLS